MDREITKDRLKSEVCSLARSRLRRNCRDSDGHSVLHDISFLCPYLVDEAVPTVRLLLKLAANPNVADNFGQSPLHLLAEELEKVEIRDTAAHLLLEAGAHLDMVTDKGYTAADNWMYASNHAGLNFIWNDLPNWLKEGCKKLTCLSARVIRYHQLPYDASTLPATLIPFVHMH